MAKTHVISKDFESEFRIDTPGSTWVFTKQSEVISPAWGIRIFNASDVKLSVFGHVESTSTEFHAAILSDSANFRLNIEKGAEVIGSIHSVLSTGENAWINNAGTSNNIRVSGDHSTVINSGKITDFFSGIYVYQADDWSVTNTKSGKIICDLTDQTAYPNSVHIVSETGDSGTLTNHGLIRSVGLAGGEGDEKVVNRGRIEADVLLQGGSDVFDNRGGTLVGTVRGGVGDDMLVTNHAVDLLKEVADEGIDTVRTSVTYQLNDHVERLELTGKKDVNGTGSDNAGLVNYLQGNSGNNTLSGLAGVDGLSGGKGRDMLTGGAGTDFFELAKGSGKDTVTDFIDGTDIIVINGFAGVDDFSDISSRIEQKENFVEIDMGKGDVLIIKGGVIAAQLGSGDFRFNLTDSDLFDLFG